MQNRRLFIFLGLCFVCALGLGAFIHGKRSALQQSARVTPLDQGHETSDVAPSSTSPLAGQILFRYTGVDADYGKLAMADLARRDQPRFVDGLSCEAVYFAAGQGICLSAERGVFTTYAAQLFDEHLSARKTIPLTGGPSRARVSPDGTLAAYTVFVTGHSYTSLNFSTETVILATSSGERIASIEEDFRVLRNGENWAAKDFNFWGVTFAPDSRSFYCTLSSNQRHYLVKGDIGTREATVIHENVECPSLSPDGKRVAYKKRFVIGGRLIWQLHVLDLATMVETSLGEKRSVDDQLEWLDNDHVLYAVSDSENPERSSATTNVWKADAAGRNRPELFLAKAYSPSVVR